MIAAGSLALYDHCTFINNEAIGGSSSSSTVSGYGGAIYIDGTRQVVIGPTVTFLNNTADCAYCIFPPSSIIFPPPPPSPPPPPAAAAILIKM